MLHVVYINNKGFISTFNKATNEYSTTTNIDEADCSTTLEEAESTATFFNGIALSVKED